MIFFFQEVTLGWRFKEKLKEVKEKHENFDCIFGYTDLYGKRKMKTYNVVEEAMTLMRAYLEENNMNLAELFTEIDTDGSMSVSYDEFKEGLRVTDCFNLRLQHVKINQILKLCNCKDVYVNNFYKSYHILHYGSQLNDTQVHVVVMCG